MLAEDTAEHRELFGPDGEAVVYFRNPDGGSRPGARPARRRRRARPPVGGGCGGASPPAGIPIATGSTRCWRSRPDLAPGSAS